MAVYLCTVAEVIQVVILANMSSLVGDKHFLDVVLEIQHVKVDTDIVVVQPLDNGEVLLKIVGGLMVLGSLFVEFVVAVLDMGTHKTVMEDED